MIAFSRLTSILFFLLSLSFLTCALPTQNNQALAARHTGNEVVNLLVDLDAKVCAHAAVLVDVKAIAEAEVRVKALVADVEACAHAILALGAKVDVDATVKADIAVKVAAIVTVIVKACVSLVAKFGIALCLTILAQVDICLKLLLVNLSVCVEGIIALVVKIVASLGVDAFVGVHLNLCLGVLGYLKL